MLLIDTSTFWGVKWFQLIFEVALILLIACSIIGIFQRKKNLSSQIFLVAMALVLLIFIVKNKFLNIASLLFFLNMMLWILYTESTKRKWFSILMRITFVVSGLVISVIYWESLEFGIIKVSTIYLLFFYPLENLILFLLLNEKRTFNQSKS